MGEVTVVLSTPSTGEITMVLVLRLATHRRAANCTRSAAELAEGGARRDLESGVSSSQCPS